MINPRSAKVLGLTELDVLVGTPLGEQPGLGDLPDSPPALPCCRSSRGRAIRTFWMQRLFSDVLPPATITRPDKAGRSIPLLHAAWLSSSPDAQWQPLDLASRQ